MDISQAAPWMAVLVAFVGVIATFVTVRVRLQLVTEIVEHNASRLDGLSRELADARVEIGKIEGRLNHSGASGLHAL